MRTIHTRPGARTPLLDELLQTVFVAELIAPSASVWLLSPWVTDIAVVDNRGGEISSVAPGAPRRELRLTEVLGRMVELGSTVTVVTRRGAEHNLPVLSALRAMSNVIRLVEDPDLHEKTLLTDRFVISGSMNFTWMGQQRNAERVTFSTDPNTIARDLQTFEQRFGPSENAR